MSKFDTHGGYFAPKDYMKVEAGGSHEENPNGGVQIGVDQEGTPNLLEEGEPVYKDYVYSDNIKASERFLKENNIPEKYAGELYSKIADSFFSEAENRPYDPISRNGLEAMLGRLADAQEGQKAYNEQRQLKRELESLSPDELAALEEMLATGEQQAMEQQAIPAEPVQQPMVPQEPMMSDQAPVMRCGGKINKFFPGGDLYGGPGMPSYPLGGLDRFVDRTYARSLKDIQEQIRFENEAKDYARRWLEANGKKATDANINKIARDIAYSGLLEFDGNQVGVSPRSRRQRWLPMDEWNSHNGRYDFNLPKTEAPSEANGPEVPIGDDGLQYAGVVSGGLVDYPQLPSATTQTPAQAPSQSTGNGVRYSPIPRELQDIVNAQSERIQRNNRDELYLPKGPGIDMPIGRAEIGNPVGGLIMPEEVPVQNEPAAVNGNPYLSTFPRYAGAIGSGLLGLYNAVQRPDRYTAQRYKPFVPSGRISLQDQVYNPVDQNMMMNQVLAQGNSAQRSLRNSGLGPSTAAAMVAQDNNITGNLGNTFLQTWDANNQRRNQVIAANNQNEAQRAQFDYAIDAARQRALADAQMRNAYTDLQLQQLNNAAEGEKFAAVSNQVSNGLQALSGIGQENFAMNQVNSNPYFEGYGVFGNGTMQYAPWLWNYAGTPKKENCGGHIQRKKK